jgi:hypothetical protein
MEPPFDTPSEVTAEDGEVLMDGPGSLAISFTPDAALETSQRLLDGGLAAQVQNAERGRKGERGE